MSGENDLLTNFGTQSVRDVRARRIYNEELNNNGLIIESVTSALDIKVDWDFTTSVTGNIVVGSTGYYDANLSGYWDINTGASGCIHVGTEFCLEANSFDMNISNNVLETIGGNKVENITSFLEINTGTSACINALTEFCIETNNMTVGVTSNLVETIGGNHTSNVTGHIGITSGTTISLSADEILLNTTTLILNGVTSLALCDGIIKVSNGLNTSPSYTFCNDLDTGMYLSGANQLSFGTSGTQRVVIDSSGNVGIGTNNPTQTLDVNGDALIQGGDLYLTNTNYKVASNGTTSLGLFTAGTEQVTIGSTGNVGIGSTTPTQTLDVNGDALIQGGDLYLVDTNEKIASDGTDMFFHVNGTEVVRFESGGNVGIGTNNPTQTLDVNGDALIQGGDLYLVDTNEKIASDGTDMFFHVNGAEVVRFESGGNVGIGTNNPTHTLHVQGNTLLNGTLGVTGNTTITTTSTTAFVVEDNLGEDCFRVNTINCTTYLQHLGVSGDVTIEGNLTVNGTQTILNTETVNVDDNNIVLNGISSPTDITAHNGGITLQGDNNYTILWDQNCIHAGYGVTAAWTFNQNVDVDNSLGYYIDCKIHHDQKNLVVNTRTDNNTGAFYLSTNDITTPAEGDWRMKTALNASGNQVIEFQRYQSGSWTTRQRIN